MRSRIAIGTLLGLVGLLVFGVTLTRSEGSADPDQSQQKPRERQTRAERRAERNTLKLPGPGRHLAFDVRPRDHRSTIRYVLEITHPSGEVSTRDLQKPALQRQTILVPVPELPPGEYKLVVIAESKAGNARSGALTYQVK